MTDSNTSRQDPSTKCWARSGEFQTAVSVDSAVLQLPDLLEVKVPVNADHSNMVKFDKKQDPGYQSAIQYLRAFEKDAPRVVSERFGMWCVPSKAS